MKFFSVLCSRHNNVSYTFVEVSKNSPIYTVNTMYNVKDIMSIVGRYLEYIGGMFSTFEGEYHERIGGCSLNRRDTMSTLTS